MDDLSRALGINHDWLNIESLERIEQWLLKRGHADRLDLVAEQRRPVFAGGFAIISAIFTTLVLERLDCASGALREGVLYDLNGRLRNRDSRDQGVEALVKRFNLDRDQADRVQNTCLEDISLKTRTLTGSRVSSSGCCRCWFAVIARSSPWNCSTMSPNH